MACALVMVGCGAPSFASFSQKPKWSVSFPARKTSMDGRSAKETIGPNGLLMALSFVTYCGAIYRYRPGLMPVTDLKSRVKCAHRPVEFGIVRDDQGRPGHKGFDPGGIDGATRDLLIGNARDGGDVG